jgi:hypothetical protein
MINLKGYLRADQVADRFKVALVTVYTWVQRGHLQRVEVLPGRYLFAEAEVRRFAKLLPLKVGNPRRKAGGKNGSAP